jgi:predicted dehydrogenase
VNRVRVALIGANGHGLWHRRHLAARQDRVVLAALCDPAPITDADGAVVPTDAAVFTDHRAMLAEIRPDVVVICTPPHTHLDLATDALRSGADILLEKPPVLSVSEHMALAGVLASTGRIAQIGFQALGSPALARLLETVHSGLLGPVTGVSAIAAWQRSDAYYERAPWAGRRSLGGRPVLDGALVNPLAHAVMQSLVVAGAVAGDGSMTAVSIKAVEVERYRTRPIEVEDTACLRVTLADAPPVVVAVTLCGEDFIRGEVIVHGTGGRAVLEYPTDRLLLPGHAAAVEVPGRVSLLDNLLEHRLDRSVPLIAPLARTLPFTRVVEAIAGGPPPADINPHRILRSGEPPETYRTITGINDLLRASAERGRLLSELGVDWATAPHRWSDNSVHEGVQLRS